MIYDYYDNHKDINFIDFILDATSRGVIFTEEEQEEIDQRIDFLHRELLEAKARRTGMTFNQWGRLCYSL